MATGLIPLRACETSPGELDLDIEDFIADYLAGCSGPSAACYQGDIDHLRQYLRKEKLDLLTARRADMARWVRAQEEAGVPATTIRRRLSGVAGFYSYLVTEKVLAFSPAEGLRRPKGGSAPRLGLAAEDLAKFLEAARAKGKPAELLISLLLVQGLRVSEACGLDDKDLVAYEGHQALLLTRKGGRVELVGATEQVAKLIREVVVLQGPGPLLRGRRGGRLSRQVAWRWIRDLAQKAGIDQSVHPHLLRHSHVSQALLGGVPLPVVSGSAGHRDIRTTLVYAQALSSLGAQAGKEVLRRIDNVNPVSS